MRLFKSQSKAGKISIISLAIIFSIIFSIVSVYFAYALCALGAIGLEDVFRKWKINNPYVNDRFRSCQQISLVTGRTMCIPEEWSFEENDGIYKIYDQNNELWAIGTVFGTENDRFADSTEFISESFSLEDIHFTLEGYTAIPFMEGAHIYQMHVQGSNGEAPHFYIALSHSSEPRIVFILKDDISQNAQSFDVAEAIMYSFAWPNRTKRAHNSVFLFTFPFKEVILWTEKI